MIIYWTNPTGTFSVEFMILVGAGMCFSILVLLKRFTKDEIAFVRELFEF